MASCIVSGIFTDPQGNAVSGATIRVNLDSPVFDASGSLLMPKEVTTTTATDGSWSISLIQSISCVLTLDLTPTTNSPVVKYKFSMITPAATTATFSSCWVENPAFAGYSTSSPLTFSDITGTLLPTQFPSTGLVTSVNGETGAVVVVAGSGISVTPSGQDITVTNTNPGPTVYLTFADFPPTATTGSLAVAADTGNLYEFYDTTWVRIAGPDLNAYPELWISQYGSDTTGNGSFNNPYATVAHAYSTITNPNITTVLKLSGTITESASTTILNLNNVQINGDGYNAATTWTSADGNLFLTWDASAVAFGIFFSNINIIGSNIVFDTTAAPTSASSFITFDDTFIQGTFNGRGQNYDGILFTNQAGGEIVGHSVGLFFYNSECDISTVDDTGNVSGGGGSALQLWSSEINTGISITSTTAPVAVQMIASPLSAAGINIVATGSQASIAIDSISNPFNNTITLNGGATLTYLSSSDYISNASTVTGVTVTDALNTLKAASSAEVTTVGALDSEGSPSANGASISAPDLIMQSASATVPGLVNTTTQSFAGNKTFTGTITSSNISGTNTGNITLAAVGTSPNADAASLSGQALTLQPFNSTNPGVVSASGGGTANYLRADGTWDAPPGTTGGTVTAVSVATANGLAGSSSGGTTPALTLSTTINSPVLSGNGTAIAAATTTGTGSIVVLATSPTLVTPALGTPSSGVATNLTGTASGLTAGIATNIAGGSGGSIPYQSAANTTALLANGSAGQFLKSQGTTLAPVWSTGSFTPLAPTKQILTSGTTYTTPTSPVPLYIKVTTIGGGGGSANAGANPGGGCGGGGGGGAAIRQINSPTTSYTYSIGGAGGVGTGGGSTSFGSGGSSTAASGGAAGTSSGVSPQGAVGGAGGTGTSGDILLTGEGGGTGSTSVSGVVFGSGGNGGSGASQYGGGGAVGTPSGTANAGNVGGGGAGGTCAGGLGNSGGVGMIIVEEFYQ